MPREILHKTIIETAEIHVVAIHTYVHSLQYSCNILGYCLQPAG